jgi:hypothetical protein
MQIQQTLFKTYLENLKVFGSIGGKIFEKDEPENNIITYFQY